MPSCAVNLKAAPGLPKRENRVSTKTVMKENQFTVDLGNLKLTDIQRAAINASIHKAVAGELADYAAKNSIVLVPVTKWKDGPIINGIIVRNLLKADLTRVIAIR